MRAGRVICVGSINVDDVIECGTLPRPGETVLARGNHLGFGGKGANQAAAAARFGAVTCMVGAVGDDPDGAAARDDLAGWGVDTAHVKIVAGRRTGRALVLLDDHGENAIAVVSGANADLTAGDVTAALDALEPTGDDVVLVGAEIPPPCVDAAARTATATGSWLLHNLAPARELLAAVTGPRAVLVVNEIEALQVAGVEAVNARADLDAVHAFNAFDAVWDVLLGRVGHVVVTRGSRGAETRAAGGDRVEVPAARVEAVDTTGAGDAFCGAFAAVLAGGGGVADALRLAVAAGGVAVTAAGARGALARRDELA